MKLKVCTKAELLGLEKILFEKDLSLDTYIRFMNKVKDNFLEHTNVIEKMKEQPFYRLEYFLEEPSTGDYINDINNYFKRYMLIRGGVYRGDAKTCKIDRNLAVSMYDIMALRKKRSKSWFRKKLLTNSQIEKIEASGQWKKILG
ncbi:MAG: hypothetical protein U9Q69_01610, partial [Nanoarchaeota archaeon]|nr:hypothetical protein [Nanoarchaeota archaeon]